MFTDLFIFVITVIVVLYPVSGEPRAFPVPVPRPVSHGAGAVPPAPALVLAAATEVKFFISIYTDPNLNFYSALSKVSKSAVISMSRVLTCRTAIIC